MANGNGNGGATERMERVAESTQTKFTARLMMAYVVPALLTIIGIGGGWLAERMLKGIDETAKVTNDTARAVIEIRGQLAPIVRDQGVMQQQIEQNRGALGSLEKRVEAHVGRHDTTDKRLDGLDQRNREQDGQIRDIERRVWRMPEPTPAPPPGREPFEPYPPTRAR